MKTLAKFGFCVFLGSAVSGCGAMSTSGGTAGWAENHLLFKANDDIEYIYRAMSITAALSAAATANPHTISNTGNAKQAISQINGLVETLDSMYAIATSTCGSFDDNGKIKTVECEDTYLYKTRFQSLTPDVDRQIINLASVSLTSDSYKKLAESIESGNYTALPIEILKIAMSIIEIENQAFGSVRQTIQEYNYTYSTDAERRRIGSKTFSYEEALATQKENEIDKTTRKEFYNHYLQSTFVTIQQNCFNIRGKLSQSDQKIDNISNSYYFDRSDDVLHIKPGRSENNCPIGPYFGKKFTETGECKKDTCQKNYDGAAGKFKGINIGRQTSPVICPSGQDVDPNMVTMPVSETQTACKAKSK